jgi:putative transposase
MKIINLLEPKNKDISIKRQCSLLGISRTQHYYKKKSEKDENMAIMEEIDKQYLLTPFYGARRFEVHIERN